ncbi:Kiwa anti-phage protein KwaB-like domain-containing protein [Dyella mobilis]|uniref:DUF4868 domain-containing protein n=1 Tax=Dyella mobilis TaxID=1849582 RepID=A0ABS2KKQ9_9GAMM|nr:Kiwa anti-phage protein KwaB-like domain-containing protein [Dyella mobilis]MBM7131003.1 DUF4868 domain-containing protein [Dyella mobilis]GLQ97629.1 DUF4868 domain-containing protein [Dyella mobilis]
MTQKAFVRFQDFDFDNSDVHLWVFKRSTTEAKYVASYVRTDEDLDDALIRFAKHEQERITEWSPYSYLAETNQNGCLLVSKDETNFDLLKEAVDEHELDRSIDDVNQFKRALGYLVKFVNQSRVVYAVRRSPSTWKTAYRKRGVINAFFRDGKLSAVEGEEFAIEPNFDFFAFGNFIFVSSKSGFESMMRYRDGYEKAFETLQQTQSFTKIFTDIKPMVEYVGKNAMHLKRMATVEQMKLYMKPNFIKALQKVNKQNNWGIKFDQNNHIILTAKTMPVILKVFLDQRLLSEVTHITYDVPSGVKV